MMKLFSTLPLVFLSTAVALQPLASQSQRTGSIAIEMKRRQFGWAVVAAVTGSGLLPKAPANAEVFFDPAQYGDQELRVAAVDSIRESVRRAILKNPNIAPSFYQLALLDGLSYNAQTKQFGPDSSVVKAVLSSKETDSYTKNLQEACLALIEAEKVLRRKTAITLADAIAIGGAESIETIGGPVLPVQLGRADAPLKAPISGIPLDLFSGNRPSADVVNAFRQAGLTDREMTALLSGLLTLDYVEKTRTTEDWKMSSKPKFREAGKMGRMSEFKRLTEEDIRQAEIDAELDLEDPDDGWYIADSFGTREGRFGERLGKDSIDEKNFNKYIKSIAEASGKGKNNVSEFGWVAEILTDKDSPTTQAWISKYAGSNLSYVKDLTIAFNSVTQLGAVFTGGKYENLLKNRPRKSLNDDDLNLF